MTMLSTLILLAAHPLGLTMTLMPTRMAQALEKLSAATGKTLTATPVFDDYVLIANLTDAPVDETLVHLAEARGNDPQARAAHA